MTVAVPDKLVRRIRLAALIATVPLLFLFTVLPGDDGTIATSPPESFSAKGADTCLGCHNNEDMLILFRTPHGQQADPESPMAQQQCEDCHGPGGEHSKRGGIGGGRAPMIGFGSESATPVADQNAVCTACHADDVTLAWHGSVHERNDIGCANCHSVHAATDPVGLHSAQAEICLDCHRRVRADVMKPFAHPVRSDRAVRMTAMVCTDCHSPHGSVSTGQLTRNTLNELCLSCHAEFRGPVLFDHAPVSEDCSLCHEPHGSIHPAMLTRRTPLLCQSCHSQRRHPSRSFTDDSLPGNNPSALVLERSCLNCHTQVHGSNHPSGFNLMR